MTAALQQFLVGSNWFVLAYFLLLNSVYLLLLVVATVEFTRHFRRAGFAAPVDALADRFMPPVSVIVPAHNEEVGIVDSIHAILALEYPNVEAVVVDDGSTDATFARLSHAFGLREIPAVIPDDVPTVGAVRSIHAAGDGAPVVVVRKDGTGTKADALNVGINAARHELVCMVDADALLDRQALLRVVRPFVDDPLRTVVAGGVIRPVNGSPVDRGRVEEVRMPRGLTPRVQVVEYLRAFLIGRTGWSRLGCLLIVSGAFGVFRRDVVVDVGGYAHGMIGEDAELVVRMHRHLRDEGRPYRIAFVAEPVCWTEVPTTLAALGRQRRRWARGLAETLWRHRAALGNPRYGKLGWVAMPYHLVFEVLGPVVELVGVVAVVVALALGLVDSTFALLLAGVAFGFGFLLSLASLTVEEFAFSHYRRWRDLGRTVVAAGVENCGYRQLNAWWRLRGTVDFLRGRAPAWGDMARTGFTTAASNGPAALRSADACPAAPRPGPPSAR